MNDSLRSLLRVVRPVRGRVVLAGVCEAVGAAAALGLGWLVVTAVVHVLTGPDRAWLPAWTASAAVAALLAWVGRWLGLFHSHRADNALQLHLRNALVDRIRTGSLTWVDTRGSVAVKRIVSEDVDALHHLVGHAYGHIVSAAVQSGIGLVVLAVVAPLPTAVALVPATIALVLSHRQRQVLPTQMARYQQATGRVDAAGVEFVHGIAPLKVFGGQERGLARFRAAANEYARFVSGWAASVTPTMTAQQVLLSPPAVWLALGACTLLTPVTPLQAAAVAVILPMLLSPVESLAFALQDLGGAVTASHRINDVLGGSVDRQGRNDENDQAPDEAGRTPDRTPAADSRNRQAPLPTRVELRDVTVRFEDHAALDRVAATFPVGGLTVLLGHSGSGKSTLLELVARLREPTSGTVHVRPETTRTSALWQRPWLLQATVADNLRLTAPDADPASLRRATETAGIADRINTLPDGYDTLLAGGGLLSGGEQQRLCLARALLADPGLLLLDEPTSAVDPASAQVIDTALAGLRGRATIIRSDHRLAVAEAADHVIVLDAGRVVEAGPPADLLALSGHYARMLSRDTRGDTTRGTTS